MVEFGLAEITQHPTQMAQASTEVRNDALARATALAKRARELRHAQREVQELTANEVRVLARTAASFFESIPLPEFTSTLLPPSARGLRRIRHRMLHRTIQNTETGMLIHALLLGRDGMLRLFAARSADSRDLLLILEPGRSLPVGVMREVVDWTPAVRIPGFRPFEILDRLSHSLDAVEEQLGEAEERVQVQKAALTRGDLSALLPGAAAPKLLLASTAEPVVATPGAIVSPTTAERSVPVEPAKVADDLYELFDRVEAVANASSREPIASVLPVIAPELEPDEWDDPVEPSQSQVARKEAGSSRNSASPTKR
jgi:hypothetical protein